MNLVASPELLLMKSSPRQTRSQAIRSLLITFMHGAFQLYVVFFGQCLEYIDVDELILRGLGRNAIREVPGIETQRLVLRS